MMITNNHLFASTFSIWSMSHEPPSLWSEQLSWKEEVDARQEALG